MVPAATLPRLIGAAVEALQAGNIDGWMTIYAPDAVHEFPFAPKDGVQKLEGREEIAAYMGQLPKMIRFGELSDIRVREAGDELIIEATGHHRRVSDDAQRAISYVWFITLRDGKVVHFRDYMNPLQLASI